MNFLYEISSLYSIQLCCWFQYNALLKAQITLFMLDNESDIDIDSNFFSLGAVLGTSNDEKFDATKFNDIFNENHCNDLKVFHLNMCSFPRNVNSLLTYLSTLKQQFDVICLSETWLNEGRFIENYFPDYNKYFSKRPVSQSFGGGCAIFVKQIFQSY